MKLLQQSTETEDEQDARGSITAVAAEASAVSSATARKVAATALQNLLITIWNQHCLVAELLRMKKRFPRFPINFHVRYWVIILASRQKKKDWLENDLQDPRLPGQQLARVGSWNGIEKGILNTKHAEGISRGECENMPGRIDGGGIAKDPSHTILTSQSWSSYQLTL